MRLFHFSEDPSIERFTPHVAPTSAIRDEPFVWAIDDWHAPMYFTPRDCPRACFWPGARTSTDDREIWLHGLEPRFVMCVEAGWLAALRQATVYRYEMPVEGFAPGPEGAHWVSRGTVEPLGMEPVGDLVDAIVAAGVELRLVSRLGPLWRRVTTSTLEFSGTRLRNAIGYPADFK